MMEIPTQIGKYRILKKLGQGASGCVLKAEQNMIKRQVALKILFTDTIKLKPNIIKRFKREARLAASLVHPNIVPIFEIEESGGIHYYTMQFVQGVIMTEYIKNHSYSLSDKLAIFIQLADALALAHSRDVIHRDLKPHNVIISGDLNPIILDFGIAKSLMDDEQMTRTGHILGSAHYMAPEQAKSEGVGTYTDVFGVGVMMYEAFTGERPFKGNNVRDLIIERLEYGQNKDKPGPIPMSEIVSSIPDRLEEIVFKCLQPLPADRYATAQELLVDLQGFQEDMQLTENLIYIKSTDKKAHTLVNKKKSYFYPFLLGFVIFAIGFSGIAWLKWGQNKYPFLDRHLQFLKKIENWPSQK